MELVSHLEAALENAEDETTRYHIRAALQYARSLEDEPEVTVTATGLSSEGDEPAEDAPAVEGDED